jgi:hypothetical protein
MSVLPERPPGWKCFPTGEYVYHDGVPCAPCTDYVQHLTNEKHDLALKTALLDQADIWRLRVHGLLPDLLAATVEGIVEKLVAERLAQQVSVLILYRKLIG